MQGRVPRRIERQTFSSSADFQGVFSGLRRGSHPNHRRNGFFIRDRHVPRGRGGCPVRGKGSSTERVPGMAAEDYRAGRRAEDLGRPPKTWKAKVRNVPRGTLYVYICYNVYVRTTGVK